MKQFYGYIRVSTAKQGEQGVSLQEQRDAIARHAGRNGLDIVQWFEERETAAKRGRPVFNHMVKLLRHGRAGGAVIHKIDRSARNLKDWSDLGELIDQGIEVHFANESLDMHSRGGRLAADIQAVVAADYIRNLREETRKGFYGRLKQGLYPLPAPVGYLDQGKGKVKEPDPMTAPLVRMAFESYATGQYNLETLGEKLHAHGLRNKRGGRVTRTGLSMLLNNPFYIGLIRLRRTGEVFPGAHAPLITKSLFDRVRTMASGKYNVRTQRHAFLFRRLVSCANCAYCLIGELHKGHVYYRCQNKRCPTTCVREEIIEAAFDDMLRSLVFGEDEKVYFRRRLDEMQIHWKDRKQDEIKALRLQADQQKERLRRLTDAFLDGTIERPLFEERKAALLMEMKTLEENLTDLRQNCQSRPDHLFEFLELAGSAYFLYKMAVADEKRDLVQILTSNRSVEGKNVSITLSNPFQEVAKRSKNINGVPTRN